MEWGQLVKSSLLAGAVFFAGGFLFHLLVPLAAPQVDQDYRNETLFRPWAGWTRIYMFAHPWLYGILFAAGFLAIRRVAGAENFGGPRDGTLFGLAVFLVGSLPVYALNYASFQVPARVIGAWVLQSASQYTAAGLVLGWYYARARAA